MLSLMRLTGYGKRPPAAFSRRLEAQRAAQRTLRLFAGCGLAGRHFVASCTAGQCHFTLDIRDGNMGQYELFRNLLRSTNDVLCYYRVLSTKGHGFLLLEA